MILLFVLQQLIGTTMPDYRKECNHTLVVESRPGATAELRATPSAGLYVHVCELDLQVIGSAPIVLPFTTENLFGYKAYVQPTPIASTTPLTRGEKRCGGWCMEFLVPIKAMIPGTAVKVFSPPAGRHGYLIIMRYSVAP